MPEVNVSQSSEEEVNKHDLYDDLHPQSKRLLEYHVPETKYQNHDDQVRQINYLQDGLNNDQITSGLEIAHLDAKNHAWNHQKVQDCQRHHEYARVLSFEPLQ